MQKVTKGNMQMFVIDDIEADASSLTSVLHGTFNREAKAYQQDGILQVEVPSKGFYAELNVGDGLIVGFFGELRHLKANEMDKFYL